MKKPARKRNSRRNGEWNSKKATADEEEEDNMKGIFISFEGIDGSGKSTQFKLFSDYLRSLNADFIMTREPGGTDISEKIRNMILDPSNKEMDPMTEALLFAASRAQHVEQLIRPALKDGKIVICDRFIDSSIAYQGYGRELGDCVRKINEYAVSGTVPDITFYLDLDPSVGRQRNQNAGKVDRMELELLDFHNKVYEGYKELSIIYKDRFVTIDASQSIDSIAEQIRKYFEQYRACR